MSKESEAAIQEALKVLGKRYGSPPTRPLLPPPSSADAEAAQEVALKNSETIAGFLLGLHGPPEEGLEAARRLMAQFVDWNEVRVASPASLVRVLGETPRAAARGTLFQRFLETYFLRQRNMNIEYLANLKPPERKQLLAGLQIFGRDELAALLLTCFDVPVFPPAEPLHRVAQRAGLIGAKATVLQMAKTFESWLGQSELLALYSHLYHVANEFCHVDRPACAHCPLKVRCPSAAKRTKARRETGKAKGKKK